MRFALLVPLLALAGCGPSKPAPPPILVVTLDGTPTSYLAVQLVGDAGPAANGVTDSAGRVTLAGGDGKPLPPGPYKVVVTDTGESDDYGNDTARDAKPRPKNRVAAAYGKAATTPAALAVEAGKGEYAVEVKSK